jgi:5-methylcytosine-specific restriction endonuclease McrA
MERRAVYRWRDIRKRTHDLLLLSQADFVAWYVDQPDRCAYCGLTRTEAKRLRLRVRGPRGGYLVSWDIDRLEPSRGYELDNLVLSCSVCNTAKGAYLTGEEAKMVGKAIRRVWDARLAGEARNQVREDLATPQLVARMQAAIDELDALNLDAHFADEDVESELRTWLDTGADPLPWTYPERVTEDEWFFITTLYGEMTMAGQRAHIRRFYPLLFVRAAARDIRNFAPGMREFKGLRSSWMSTRICRMSEILRDRGITMAEYSEHLRQLEASATPEDPMPALDAIVKDHRATGWKTLSVFVRDCVGGNCFPIDSRVEEELRRFDLPVDERALVRMVLHLGQNPREIARMFYVAGGD